MSFPPDAMRQDWLYSKTGVFFVFFHFERPWKEQAPALGLLPRIPASAFGAVAGPLRPRESQSQFQG